MLAKPDFIIDVKVNIEAGMQIDNKSKIVFYKDIRILKHLLFFIIPLVLYFVNYQFILDKPDTILITLVLTAVIFWSTSIIPEYQTAIYFLFICLFFELSERSVIFSGFYSSAFWLVFSGMVIVIAIKNLELNAKILSVFKLLSVNTYLRILILITAFTLVICFIIPSAMNRIVITIPILHVICSNLGYDKGTKGYTGIMLIGIVGNSLPGFVLLPANLPNMILAGLAENIYNYKLLYSNYFVSNFIIMGFIKCIIAIAVIYFLYKDEPQKTFDVTNEPMKQHNNMVLLVILAAIMLLWLTDSMHGIAPSFVAVFGALALLYPGFNIIKAKELTAINFPTLIFVAGLISLGNILAHNEFIKQNLEFLVSHYDFSDNSFINYMAITIFTSISGIFLTQPTIPPLFTPLAGQLSELTGFSLNDIFMMQAASFSNIFFMHQSPPIIIGMQLAFLKVRDVTKILLIIASITIVFLYPLHYLWLQFLN